MLEVYRGQVSYLIVLDEPKPRTMPLLLRMIGRTLPFSRCSAHVTENKLKSLYGNSLAGDHLLTVFS